MHSRKSINYTFERPVSHKRTNKSNFKMMPPLNNLSKMEVILLSMLLAMTVVAIFLFQSLPIPTAAKTNSSGGSSFKQEISVSSSNAFGSATSGKLFSGTKVRSFTGTKIFDELKDLENEYRKFNVIKSKMKAVGSLNCENWGVVTTIFEPSDAIRKQVLVPGWCLIVVGDKKGPLSYDVDAPLNNFVFLNASQQENLIGYFPVIKALPWNHFGRKNVGYLYAILHGAKTIWDFDDDNINIDQNFHYDITKMSNSSGETAPFYALEPENYDSVVLNPYPLMGANVAPVWPRGFPLERIVSNSSSARKEIPTMPVEVDKTAVGILQSLANHDPDVDAIYRLTMPLPFDFPRRGNTQALMVPIGSYSPYNAQATMHMYSSLWSLLLPVTVHGRVSDIWRGYFAQRLGEDIGMRLAFIPPVVVQIRNSHNYLADFDSEEPLYKRSLKLVEQLIEWKSEAPTLPARIEALWVYLYERGYIEIKDVELVQAWLQSLFAAGYRFPTFDAKAKAKSTKVKARARSPTLPISRVKSGPYHPPAAGNHTGSGRNHPNGSSLGGRARKH